MFPTNSSQNISEGERIVPCYDILPAIEAHNYYETTLLGKTRPADGSVRPMESPSSDDMQLIQMLRPQGDQAAYPEEKLDNIMKELNIYFPGSFEEKRSVLRARLGIDVTGECDDGDNPTDNCEAEDQVARVYRRQSFAALKYGVERLALRYKVKGLVASKYEAERYAAGKQTASGSKWSVGV